MFWTTLEAHLGSLIVWVWNCALALLLMLGSLLTLGPVGQHSVNRQPHECLQGALHAQPHGQQQDGLAGLGLKMKMLKFYCQMLGSNQAYVTYHPTSWAANLQEHETMNLHHHCFQEFGNS